MSNLLSARNVRKVYHKGSADVEVLSDLTFEIDQGDQVAITGASGVGKSTLLNLLGALDRPSSGEILFRDEPISSWSSKQRARFRNETVGFIFQFHYLLPEFTAEENVAIPLLVRGIRRTDALTEAKQILDRVGLSHRLSHRSGELSGGEQQRVAIARAIVSKPQILLADEPTGNLDTKTAEAVSQVLFDITKDEKRSLVLVTHNVALAKRTGRVLKMAGGTLRDNGSQN